MEGTKGKQLARGRPKQGESQDDGNGREHRPRVRFGRRSAVSSDALNERLTRIRLTIVTTSEKNVSARTSCSGMPDLSAMTKMAATSANASAPAAGSRRPARAKTAACRERAAGGA